MSDKPVSRTTAYPDINSGVFPVPTQPQSGQLEVVVDPQVQLGAMDMAPGATLLVIEHPRHGSLKFLLSAESAAALGRILAPS